MTKAFVLCFSYSLRNCSSINIDVSSYRSCPLLEFVLRSVAGSLNVTMDKTIVRTVQRDKIY